MGSQKGAQPRGRRLVSFSVLALLFCLLAGCRPNTNQSSGVQLLLSTAEPKAETTFELRFDQPMVGADQVDADTSPLQFDPPLAGRFVWTSTRGGVFTPGQALALGTEYHIRLRPGLTNAQGQASVAQLEYSLSTPPFGVSSWRGPQRSSNAQANPEFQLYFNADVPAAALSGRAGFACDEGKWIPATARQGAGEGDHGFYPGEGDTKTWRESFDRLHPQTNAPAPDLPAVDEDQTNPVPNLIVVTPSQPLSVGTGWRLVVDAGVRSADGRLQTRQPFQALIGEVQEFTFTNATMHHVIHREPYLELEFSKTPAAALTNAFTNWIQISPWPEGVEARVGDHRLWLNGGWLRGTNYTITLRRGLPAEEPFALGTPTNLTLSVAPIDPRLYFPEFSTEQLSGGNRGFPLLAVNVPRVRLRAKWLDAATAIHALRGYSGYMDGNPWLGQKNEGYLRLDFNLMPGRTLFSKEIDGSPAEDVAQEIPLNWDQLLGGRKSGIVFLEAERAGEPTELRPVLGTQALIQLTDLGLVWKRGDGQVRAFVFSYQTGAPVTNATVRLYSDENEPLGETATDNQGQATLPISTNAAWLAAQCGEDLHALHLKEDNIPLWSFNLPRRWHEDDETNGLRQAALFTDRDVYRPKETVELKAIFRDLINDGLGIPAGRTGLVTCVDARGRQFFRTNCTLSALGSCSTAIPLPDGPTGDYEIHLALDGDHYTKEIQLAEFQPAAFEVRLQAQGSYAAGESIELPLSARYFFGKPLSNAKIHWSLHAEDRTLTPEEFEDFAFGRCEAEARFGRRAGEFHQSGNDQLDAEARCVIHAEVPSNTVSPQPRTVSVVAEVTDADQQTISQEVEFIQHSAEFYLGIKRLDRVVKAGQELPFELVAISTDGKPWPRSVAAHVVLQHVVHQPVLIRGAGRSARYRTQSFLTNVFEQDVTISPATQLTNGPKGYCGWLLTNIAPAEAGEYLVEVTAKDPAGRETACSTDFNVTDNAVLAWDYRNQFELKMVADKTNYQAGETALLLLEAPFSGQAWVTVERESVRRSFLTFIEGNAPSIRVPLQAGDAPNVFVSVTLVRGAAQSPHQVHEPEYRIGYCQLHVSDPTSHLQVEVTPGQTNYQPGQTVTVEGRILDAAGQPAPETEVTLYAVDDGILSLTGYQAPDLEQIFFAPRMLGINSGISLPLLMSEDPEQLAFQNKGYLGGGGGREEVTLRHRFPACAFWNANLQTDGEGKVSARFAAPDAITRYRLIAVAHNARNQFGTGASRFTISKPLLIEPALPQCANLADQLQARAMVFNQTAEPAQVLVSLQLDDKAARNGESSASADSGSEATNSVPSTCLSQTLQVPANGSCPVDFAVRLTGTGQAKWIWRAQFLAPAATAFTDAVESTLRVGHVAPLLREAVPLRVQTAETNLLALLNPQLLAGAGTLTVDIANTRLVELSEAVRQLLHYPYGCVEQTGSSLLPWVLLRTNSALLALTGRDAAEANAAAQAGISRLFSMQTESGGLSYWPGQSRPMFWGSAYGAVVLGLARNAGLSVPQAEFNSLLAYLRKQLAEPDEDAPEIGTQCLALYALALAGKAEPAWHTQLFEHRERLSAEDRALLALAIATGEPSSPLAPQLLQARQPNYLPSGGHFDSPARAKAIRLLALLKSQPAGSESEQLFTELMAQRKAGHWGTTQGDAWVLVGLSEQVNKTEAGAQPDTGTCAWAAATQSFSLESAGGLARCAFPLEPARATQALTLRHAASQPLFVQLTVESRLPAAGSAPQDHGFSLSRRYDKLDDQNHLQPAQALRVGERVLVTLRLSVPEAVEYVALDDPLPAVLEAIHPEFKTQQAAVNSTSPGDQEATPWWGDFQELRADRMLFFRDQLPAGKYLIRYVARVRCAGKVLAPVAKAEEMYHPDRFGLTEAQPLNVEAGN